MGFEAVKINGFSHLRRLVNRVPFEHNPRPTQLCSVWRILEFHIGGYTSRSYLLIIFYNKTPPFENENISIFHEDNGMELTRLVLVGGFNPSEKY